MLVSSHSAAHSSCHKMRPSQPTMRRRATTALLAVAVCIQLLLSSLQIQTAAASRSPTIRGDQQQQQTQQGWESQQLTQRQYSPVKLFVVAGDDACEGDASFEQLQQYQQHRGRSRGQPISRLAIDDAGHPWLVQNDDNVYVSYQNENDSHPLFGAEVDMAHLLGDSLKEPVVIIKTPCKSHRSLLSAYVPPSSGGMAGYQYFEMVQHVQRVVGSLDRVLTGYALEAFLSAGSVVEGVVWWHGSSDIGSMTGTSGYEAYGTNLATLLNDFRADFVSKQLSVVVAEYNHDVTGFSIGDETDEEESKFKAMQARVVAADTVSGQSTRFVPTSVCIVEDEIDLFPLFGVDDYSSALYDSHRMQTSSRVGESFATALLELVDFDVEVQQYSEEETTAADTDRAMPVLAVLAIATVLSLLVLTCGFRGTNNKKGAGSWEKTVPSAVPSDEDELQSGFSSDEDEEEEVDEDDHQEKAELIESVVVDVESQTTTTSRIALVCDDC